MPLDPPRLVRVGISAPVYDGFDYTALASGPLPPVGTRVRVPFGRSHRIGVVLDHPQSTTVDANKLKSLSAVLDSTPLFEEKLLDLLRWSAKYYHHPVGEVVVRALPKWLRDGRSLDAVFTTAWTLTASGKIICEDASALRNAPRQREALQALSMSNPISLEVLNEQGISTTVLRRLEERQWAVANSVISEPHAHRADQQHNDKLYTQPEPSLTPAQAGVLDEFRASKSGFATFLLQGVTGSGKTEVYLRLIRSALEANQQALLLVPEIGLTPQLVARLRARFGNELAVMHSGLSDRERMLAWYRAHSADARVVVGTRSALFASLPKLGLIIVDEEHDMSFKQQTGLRYHARDVAIVRAQLNSAKVILGSATPSLESIHNANIGRYTRLSLPERIGAGGNPKLHTVDLGRQGHTNGLSTALLERIEDHLSNDQQVILFLNRRGFAPVLLCTDCGDCAACRACDSRLTVHAKAGKLRCHHCGRETLLRWECPSCGSERIAVGQGTQRINDVLESLLPGRTIARLDRDVTGRVGALDSVLADVASGRTEIIVGTQMLTKGHDFPGVTLVGILDADQGLFGTDFRSEERLAQTIIQVAGRAGRRAAAGEVVLQTYRPTHPALQRILQSGYETFAEAALLERQQSQWPPFTHLAAIRAESTQRPAVFEFLDRVHAAAEMAANNVVLLGPAAAAMERRNSRYRGQLVLQSPERASLHGLLNIIVPQLPQLARNARVRYAVDIDPIEL